MGNAQILLYKYKAAVATPFTCMFVPQDLTKVVTMIYTIDIGSSYNYYYCELFYVV